MFIKFLVIDQMNLELENIEGIVRTLKAFKELWICTGNINENSVSPNQILV